MTDRERLREEVIELTQRRDALDKERAEVNARLDEKRTELAKTGDGTHAYSPDCKLCRAADGAAERARRA